MHLLHLLDRLSVINLQVIWDYAIVTILSHFLPHLLPNSGQATTEARSRSTLEKVKHERLEIPGQSWSPATHTGKRTIDPPSLLKEKY